MSNDERRMSNDEVPVNHFDIRNSTFDIRYCFSCVAVRLIFPLKCFSLLFTPSSAFGGLPGRLLRTSAGEGRASLPPLLFTLLFTLHPSPFTFIALSQVLVGADRLVADEFMLIDGKRVGLVTNHTGVLSNGNHLADVLHATPRVTLQALFGPEHGIRGETEGGLEISHGRDAKTGARVYSLYGKIRKPTSEMLDSVDVLMFDIQDVGTRFYTYISTMSYAMEAAAGKGIPFIVLDRPNPIRGTWVEGFIRDDSLRSFVGLHPIPIAHGMTIGELAMLINGAGWLENGIKADLIVVPMKGWKREMWYDETGLQWVAPSPNMKTQSTAVVYPGTCLIEGTNLSEGRGTNKPFEYIGAPYVDGKRWAVALNSYKLPGVKFEPIRFTPENNPQISTKHGGKECGGVFIHVTDRNAYEPVKTGVFILVSAKQLFPNEFGWRKASIDRLSGTTLLRESVEKRLSAPEIVELWLNRIKKFEPLRGKYLLY